jgi:ParB/RepB/Spo0J family partition protein
MREITGYENPITEIINAIRSIGHVFKTTLIIVSVMLFCIPMIWGKSFSAPIPVKQNLMALKVGVSKACVCSPKDERNFDMETLVKKGNEAQTTDHDGNGMELKIISIDSLIIPQHHPRNDFGNLEELQGSIRRDGLQEPLLVYEIEPGKFGIIDGARRLKAAKEMGLKQILCLVKKGISEAEAAHHSYVKNVERKTLSAIEIALHIKTMKDEFGYTLNELELKGYGSPGAISNKLKLLDLPDKIQKLVKDGTLTAAHGLALTNLNTREEQERMAKRVVDFDLTAKTTERRIERYLSKKRKSKKDSTKEIIPSNDVPGVYFKDARNMSELPDGLVQLIVSSLTYGVGKGTTFKEHLTNVQDVTKEIARVLAPGGIIALNVSDIVDFIGNNGKSDQKQIQLMGHLCQTCLRKYGIFLTDEIICTKRPAWSKDRYGTYKETTVHTSYRICDNWEHVYIFRKKGEREIPSEDIVLKSKLTREQWMVYLNGVWEIEPCRNNQGHPCMYSDELVKRLIRMFSYLGDTILDPFLGSGTTVKVARELGRVGIGYERELQYKSVIMKKLGIPVDAEQPETMVQYGERMLKDDSSESEEKKTREVKVATFGRTDGVDYSNVDVVPDALEGMYTNEAQKSEDVGFSKELVSVEEPLRVMRPDAGI